MIGSRITALRNALRGLFETLMHETHGRIEFVFATAAIGIGVWLEIALWEWIAVVFAIATVVASECLNTGLEHLADRVTKEEDTLVRKAKDAAAAGVFVAVLGASAVGGLIFLPKLWALVSG